MEEGDRQGSSSGEQSDSAGHEPKDDWDLAVRFRDIQRYGYLEPKKKQEMGQKAILSILERARNLLGPVQKPYQYRVLDSDSARDAEEGGAWIELDVEESLESGEARFQVRSGKDHGILVLLDTSLSMKGEKLALLGVSVAALAMSIPADALCILGFDSEIHSIKEFGEMIRPETAIERTLSIPPGGFTNIELGLKAGEARVRSSRHPFSRVILISDGRYTEGGNPVKAARALPFIHPVKIGKDPGGRTVMREIADQSGGRFQEIREMQDLPGFLLRAIRMWVK